MSPVPTQQIRLCSKLGQAENVPHKVSVWDCKSSAAALPAVSKDRKISSLSSLAPQLMLSSSQSQHPEEICPLGRLHIGQAYRSCLRQDCPIRIFLEMPQNVPMVCSEFLFLW